MRAEGLEIERSKISMMDEDVILLRGTHHRLIVQLDKVLLSSNGNNEGADSTSTIINGFQMNNQLH